MGSDSDRRPANTRGRKRDVGRTAAILEAAGDLLLELGYDKLRIQDVAERAESGTGAIYRRWPTKEALIAEAIRSRPNNELPVTDDPIADLRALVSSYCFAPEEQPELLPGLIAAMRSDTGIREAVRDGPTLEPLRNAVARVVGADHPQLDLLTELAPATALHRSTFISDRYDAEATVNEIVALIQSIAADSLP